MRAFYAILFALAVGCGDGELSVDEYHSSAPDPSNQSTNTESSGNNASTMNPTNTVTDPVGNNSSTTTNNDTVGETNNTVANNTTGTTGMTNGTNSDPQFHPMFIAVADFMREKCISCHSAGQNGNFQIASATSTNDEVMVALDGVAATSGNLLIDPGNVDASQVWIMITNDAGEQFPPETLAIVEDWILADAPYFEE